MLGEFIIRILLYALHIFFNSSCPLDSGSRLKILFNDGDAGSRFFWGMLILLSSVTKLLREGTKLITHSFAFGVNIGMHHLNFTLHQIYETD
uniref:Uncharacterized protein n=1 Tax=Kalanchoe fedtschenkoi TaxID=63787 RepID=A0A7N0V4U1_KALFE